MRLAVHPANCEMQRIVAASKTESLERVSFSQYRKAGSVRRSTLTITLMEFAEAFPLASRILKAKIAANPSISDM